MSQKDIAARPCQQTKMKRNNDPKQYIFTIQIYHNIHDSYTFIWCNL